MYETPLAEATPLWGVEAVVETAFCGFVIVIVKFVYDYSWLVSAIEERNEMPNPCSMCRFSEMARLTSLCHISTMRIGSPIIHGEPRFCIGIVKYSQSNKTCVHQI